MFFKKILVNLLRILLIMILFLPVLAQMLKIAEFKRVTIPLNLKCEDSIFEKGIFDLEIYHDHGKFYLKLKRKRKTLCLVLGKNLYSHVTGNIYKDPNIPDKPRIKMKKNPDKKIVDIIFESGRKAKNYPFYKIGFKVKYEQ